MANKIKTCSNCGGTEFDTDNKSGETCCMECGTVLAVNNLISEVEFVEEGAASKAVGQFVSNEQHARVYFDSATSNYRTDTEIASGSQQTSIQRIQNLMKMLACQLNLSDAIVESAIVYYRMALFKNLTRARKSIHVAVSCLYMVCRIERTQHLLSDFAEVVQVDTFSVGRTFLFLARALCIQLPMVDPCLYIWRFGNKLKLGDKTNAVCNLALKLVSRMKRDWIHYGRRPSGLCGAALLVAAKCLNIDRSMKQIVRIVRLSPSTLRKRLSDIGNTSIANLTVDEFKDMDIDAIESMGVEMDPPCYSSSVKCKERMEELRKANKLRKENEGFCFDEGILEQVANFQYEIEYVLEKRARIKATIDGSKMEKVTFFEGNDIVEQPSILKEKTKKKETTKESNSDEINSDLDDEEIDSCLLTPVEVSYKTKIWMEENEKFLIEKERKKQAKLYAEMNPAPTKRKRKRKTQNNNNNNNTESKQPTITDIIAESTVNSAIEQNNEEDYFANAFSQPAFNLDLAIDMPKLESSVEAKPKKKAFVFSPKKPIISAETSAGSSKRVFNTNHGFMPAK